MIPKLSSAPYFGPLCAYVLREEAEIIGANMIGETAAELAEEFQVLRRLRSDIRNPVWHVSLSAQPGEHLTEERWVQVGRVFLKKMGVRMAEHQYVAVQHQDKAYEHIHLLVNRIGCSATVWHNRNDRWQAIAVSKELEQQFGLRQTATRFRPPKG